MILYYELYLYAERDHLSKWGSDKFFLAQSVLAPLFSVGVAYTILSTFPYCLLPAVVGKTGRGLETSFRRMLNDLSSEPTPTTPTNNGK